jgi:hypothetical protein
MMKERLDQQPPELTIFQRLRVLVNAALLQFFQKRYREEKKRRMYSTSVVFSHFSRSILSSFCWWFTVT